MKRDEFQGDVNLSKFLIWGQDLYVCRFKKIDIQIISDVKNQKSPSLNYINKFSYRIRICLTFFLGLLINTSICFIVFWNQCKQSSFISLSLHFSKGIGQSSCLCDKQRSLVGISTLAFLFQLSAVREFNDNVLSSQ